MSWPALGNEESKSWGLQRKAVKHGLNQLEKVGLIRVYHAIGSAPRVDILSWTGSTANKHSKRLKKLFQQAVRAKLLSESPAADQRIGPEVNRTRDFYIDRATASKVLSQCDPEWALIFGLCRFAGFRCPTEVLGLTWQDVDGPALSPGPKRS